MQIYRLYRSFGNLLIISQRILFVYFLAILSQFQNTLEENFMISRFPIAAKFRLLEEAYTDVSPKVFFQGKFRWKYESWIQQYSMIQLECSAESIPISLLFSCENWDTANTKWIWLALSNDVIAYENLLNQVIWMLSESRI